MFRIACAAAAVLAVVAIVFTRSRGGFGGLAAAMALWAVREKRRVQAIVLGRWTPSPQERDAIATAFGLTRDQIAWGHRTPIQHIYGHGPG